MGAQGSTDLTNDARTAYWVGAIETEDSDRHRLASEQIAALVEHPGWAALREIVERKVDVLHLSILPPGIRSHAEYIGVTSQEYALRRLLEVPDAVRLVFEREDEKRRQAAERAVRREESR
jgi:hypothetical protein